MQMIDINSLKLGLFDVAQLTSTPLQLEKVVRLDAPQTTVFEALSNHEIWPQIFPWVHEVSIDNTEAIVENGLGARRICNFGNNMILEEIIVGWHPPYAYAYAGLDETHPFGMIGHVGVVSCQANNHQITTLTWQHYFDHCNLAAMLLQLNNTMSTAVQNLIDYFGGQDFGRG